MSSAGATGRGSRVGVVGGAVGGEAADAVVVSVDGVAAGPQAAVAPSPAAAAITARRGSRGAAGELIA
jgi:hypothetical protein